MRHPRVWVARDGVAIQRFGVAIYGAVTPRRHAERSNKRGGNYRGDPVPVGRDPRRSNCEGACDGYDHSEACEILKMIRDIRKAEWIYVEESKHRNERSAEIQIARQRAPVTFPYCRQADGQRDRAGWKQILPPHVRIDFPPRINEGEILRPEQLRQIKPDDASGEQTPLNDREVEICTARPDNLPLEPRG